MVGPQQVAGLSGRVVENADIVADARLVGTWQSWYKEDIEWSLPWPKSYRVIVAWLVSLLKDISLLVNWQLK